MMCGRKVESSILQSKTKQIIDTWCQYPDIKPDDVKIIECKVCHYIIFDIDDPDNIESITTRRFVIENCYATPDKKKFYPTLDIELKEL